MGWDGPMTGRQYRAWNYWLSFIDINRPGKPEFYLMQIATEVRRVLSDRPNDIQVEDFRMKFKAPTKRDDEDNLSTSQETVESASAFSKSKWIAVFGRTKIKGLNDGGSTLLSSADGTQTTSNSNDVGA